MFLLDSMLNGGITSVCRERLHVPTKSIHGVNLVFGLKRSKYLTWQRIQRP